MTSSRRECWAQSFRNLYIVFGGKFYMKKKAIFFIDANNWYHNVKNIVKPGWIDIRKVVELISKEKNLSIVDIIWYASVPSIKDGDVMYYQHMSFLSKLEKQGIRVVTRKLQRLSNQEEKESKAQSINSLGLCNVCKPLVEESFLDLADFKKKEKGIDVWIAVDMIKKSVIEKACDVCVLISGDADFVPALKVVQEGGKEVLSTFVPFGYSFELRNEFPYLFLGRAKIMDCLKPYDKDKK